MATKFSDLYPMIRAVVDDTDDRNFSYTDSVLNQQIRLQILLGSIPRGRCHPSLVNAHAPQEDMTITDSTEFAFTMVLSPRQQGIIIFKAARSMVSPSSNEFSYKTPILSVGRKGGMERLWAYLDQMIDEVSGNSRFAASCETSLQAYVQSAYRFCRELTTAWQPRSINNQPDNITNQEMPFSREEVQAVNLIVGDTDVRTKTLSVINNVDVFSNVDGVKTKITQLLSISISEDGFTTTITSGLAYSAAEVILTGPPS